MQDAKMPFVYSEIDGVCDDALHLRFLNSLEVDAAQRIAPRLQQTIDATHRPSSLANPVFDAKVWSSKGFKSFASSKDESPILRSSWIQRLRPASHRTRLEESQIVTKVNAHIPNPAIEYENSRNSNQNFYSSPYAVTAVDQYSRALRAAQEDANIPPLPQPDVRVAPKLLPTVEALLPSYSEKLGTRLERGNSRASIKCTGFSNEVKQIVHFSAPDRPRVACSSIEGLLDFTSTVPSPRYLAAGKSSRTGKSLGEQMHGQCSTMLTRPTTNFGGTEYSPCMTSLEARMNVPDSRGMVEAAASEGRHSFTYVDSHVYAKKLANKKPSHEPTFTSSELGFKHSPVTCCHSVHPPHSSSFSFHIAENVLSWPSEHVEGERSTRSVRNLSMLGRRLEKENVNLAEESRHQSEDSSFGTIREANSSESLGCKSPLPSDFKVTLKSDQKRLCGKPNGSLSNAVKQDIMSLSLCKTNFGTDANAGVHCLSRTELGYKVSCSKEEETGYIHDSQRQSNWSNWTGYKSHACGTLSARAFTGLVSPANPSRGQASGSYSDSCGNMEGGIASTLNETTRLPAGQFSSGSRKQTWNHYRQVAMPLSNVFCEDKSLVKHKLWMQRWCAASSRQISHGYSNIDGEFKTFVGISPFSKDGDGAKTGSMMCSSDNFSLRPAKRVCHGNMLYTSKKVLPRFQTAGQYCADEMPSHFMKRFSTPSAAAMAIMGTVARQVHGTQPQRKGLFGTWAAPKPSTLATPLAQAEKCKDVKTFSKSVKEFLPKT